MNQGAESPPVACVPHAIPASERKAHFALAERLFLELALERSPRPDGYEIRLPANALAAVARFIENERLCCPFMRFVVELEPGAEVVTLQMTGPVGTREVLDAELKLDRGASGCGCHVA